MYTNMELGYIYVYVYTRISNICICIYTYIQYISYIIWFIVESSLLEIRR